MARPTDQQAGKQADRDARLAAQLRENLRRRKQQARGQSADEPPAEAFSSDADQRAEPGAGGVADPPLPKALPGS